VDLLITITPQGVVDIHRYCSGSNRPGAYKWSRKTCHSETQDGSQAQA
jgi:hypothetical protein